MTVYVYATDNGNPKRGVFVPVSVKYKQSCSETARIISNETSGDVFFRVPKFTIPEGERYGK